MTKAPFTARAAAWRSAFLGRNVGAKEAQKS